jgi:NDP-sugar pyrophosphorylase family protein
MQKKLSLTDFFTMDSQEILFKEIFFQNEIPWDPLLHLNTFFDQFKDFGIHSEIPDGAHIGNREKIYIGKNVRIEPGCYIKGPCYIGDHCEIRHAAYLREHVFLCPHVLIGHCSEVKHSYLFPHVKASHFAYIGDSVIGSHVNLGAGVKCANLRMDEKLISFFVQDQQIATPFRKMGAILGDQVQVGCNAVLNPGTLMEKQAVCYPVLNLSGYHPLLSIAKPGNVFNLSKESSKVKK